MQTIQAPAPPRVLTLSPAAMAVALAALAFVRGFFALPLMSVRAYGINHLAIEVTDIKQAVAFYEDVFGLKKLMRAKATRSSSSASISSWRCSKSMRWLPTPPVTSDSWCDEAQIAHVRDRRRIARVVIAVPGGANCGNQVFQIGSKEDDAAILAVLDPERVARRPVRGLQQTFCLSGAGSGDVLIRRT